jgi:hypothetical protein
MSRKQRYRMQQKLTTALARVVEMLALFYRDGLEPNYKSWVLMLRVADLLSVTSDRMNPTLCNSEARFTNELCAAFEENVKRRRKESKQRRRRARRCARRWREPDTHPDPIFNA